MAQDANQLVWLDMEMTGLDPERERILEMAMIVTDANLNTLAESPVWVVHQSEAQLDAMDDWCKSTHGRSGLIERVRASTLDEAGLEAEALAFMQQWVPERATPMCGNSIGQDRRFMVRYLPRLEAYFHYRNIDVSTLKELCRRFFQQRLNFVVHADLPRFQINFPLPNSKFHSPTPPSVVPHHPRQVLRRQHVEFP